MKYKVEFVCDFSVVDNVEVYNTLLDELYHTRLQQITDISVTQLPNQIVSATFISMWDDGIEVVSECKVNLITHEITDIGPNNYEGDDGELDLLQYEHVCFNGQEYRAVDYEDYEQCCKDCPNEQIYYYQ